MAGSEDTTHVPTPDRPAGVRGPTDRGGPEAQVAERVSSERFEELYATCATNAHEAAAVWRTHGREGRKESGGSRWTVSIGPWFLLDLAGLFQAEVLQFTRCLLLWNGSVEVSLGTLMWLGACLLRRQMEVTERLSS